MSELSTTYMKLNLTEQIDTIDFVPLYDNVLIKRKQEVESKIGGLYISQSSQEKSQEGLVLVVGSGKMNEECKLFPLSVKVGDKVLFGKYAGTDIKINGNEYLIMKEEEIMIEFC